MNPDGTGITQLTYNLDSDTSPTWSPDGQRIAFTSYRDGNSEIYVMDANGSNQVRVTETENDHEYNPLWSPDGSHIMFYAECACVSNIFVMEPDGSSRTNLTNDVGSSHPGSWSA